MTDHKEASDTQSEVRVCAPGVRPDILNYEDIRKMVPLLDGHP